MFYLLHISISLIQPSIKNIKTIKKAKKKNPKT